VPDSTTPAPGSGETNGTQDNWEQRYSGLQRVLAKRDETLAALTADLDRLKAEHAANDAELADFRQKTVDASEEEAARQTYEALRERFEREPPKPSGRNPPRVPEWTDVREDTYAGRPRNGTGSGYPV
jgi:hypothetical protein